METEWRSLQTATPIRGSTTKVGLTGKESICGWIRTITREGLLTGTGMVLGTGSKMSVRKIRIITRGTMSTIKNQDREPTRGPMAWSIQASLKTIGSTGLECLFSLMATERRASGSTTWRSMKLITTTL